MTDNVRLMPRATCDARRSSLPDPGEEELWINAATNSSTQWPATANFALRRGDRSAMTVIPSITTPIVHMLQALVVLVFACLCSGL